MSGHFAYSRTATPETDRRSGHPTPPSRIPRLPEFKTCVGLTESVSLTPYETRRHHPLQDHLNRDASGFFCSVIREYLSLKECVVREPYSAVSLPMQWQSFSMERSTL